MGVERTHYIMLAAKFPFDIIDPDHLMDDGNFEKYEVYEDDGYQEEVTEHHGLTMVSDGMNGKYIFIGKVIEKGLDHKGIEITDCLSFTMDEKSLLTHLIRSEFKDIIKEEDVHVTVWAFTHYH